MPLHWTIDSRRTLFIATAEGFVDRADADRMIDVLATSNILHYRKLFDGSAGDTRLSAVDILSFGVRMRELHASGPMAPLAVVLPPDKYMLLSRVLGMLAAAKRPMRIFTDRAKAMEWLDSPAIRASTPMPHIDGPPRGDG
jgi:hypothetical protein